MAAEHDLSSNASSHSDVDHEFVQVTKGNINYIASKTSRLLDMGDKMDLLSTPSTNTTSGSSDVPSPASISSLLNTRVL